MLVALALTAAACTAACTATVSGRPAAVDLVAADRALIVDFFERNNAAAGEGTEAQHRFFGEIQHPDYDVEVCSLDDLTIVLDPTLSTLRPHDGWRPPDADQAIRGRIYVVAVTVTVQRDNTVLANQIGSMHVAVLDGRAFGFAPCPK
jgi:hypothetical protein